MNEGEHEAPGDVQQDDAANNDAANDDPAAEIGDGEPGGELQATRKLGNPRTPTAEEVDEHACHAHLSTIDHGAYHVSKAEELGLSTTNDGRCHQYPVWVLTTSS